MDRALLQLQPHRTPDPRPFFYDQRRTLGVATTSTCAFLPGGVTRPTNKDLLFEEARRLGREGFERLMKQVREGREALGRNDLAAAAAALEKALALSPGHYEARVLLMEVHSRLKSVEDASAPPELADRPALGDMLAKEELRKNAEKYADKDGNWRDDEKKGEGGPATAAAKARRQRAPGLPRPVSRAGRSGSRKRAAGSTRWKPRRTPPRSALQEWAEARAACSAGGAGDTGT